MQGWIYFSKRPVKNLAKLAFRNADNEQKTPPLKCSILFYVY